MSHPKKHHFIPQFLLAEWAGNRGTLWRFTQPYRRKIAKKLVSPAEIGYRERLYTTNGLPDDYAQQFEIGFLSKVDDRAARAHEILIQDLPVVWTQSARSDWTRFISSLMFRTPENLAAYKDAIASLLLQDTPEQRAAYLRDKPEDWPDTLNDAMATIAPDWLEQAAMELLRGLIDDGDRGEKINGMVWQTYEMQGKLELLISDALLQHTMPLNAKGGYLVVPISPRRLFVAMNDGDDETRQLFEKIDADRLVSQVNKAVVSRASEFVGATDLSQLTFVEANFATEENETILKSVVRQYRERGF